MSRSSSFFSGVFFLDKVHVAVVFFFVVFVVVFVLNHCFLFIRVFSVSPCKFVVMSLFLLFCVDFLLFSHKHFFGIVVKS